jgi:hypothetical protein
MPSTRPQFAAPLGGLVEHVPTVCPAAMLHSPVQQSVFCAQMSPPCPHHDDGWHVPTAQRPEQQSPAVVQALPSVPQPDPSDVQTLFVHVWLQQSPFEVHAWLSALHDG